MMNDISKDLYKELGLSNVHQIPKVLAITINIGVGAGQKEKLAYAKEILAKITGQNPVETKARKSEAGFSIRQGWPLGAKVTLRGKILKNFQDKLVQVILPATRDFEGLKAKSFDGRGNYNFGIKDYTVFFEMPYSNNNFKIGMNICIETSTNIDDHALLLLKKIGYPFKKQVVKGEKSA